MVGNTKYAIPETATTAAGKVLQFYGERAWGLVNITLPHLPQTSHHSCLVIALCLLLRGVVPLELHACSMHAFTITCLEWTVLGPLQRGPCCSR